MNFEFKAPEQVVPKIEKKTGLEELQEKVTGLGLNINIMNQLSADDIDDLENKEEGLAARIIGARKAAEKAAEEGTLTEEAKPTPGGSSLDDEDPFTHEGKQRIVPRTIN